MTSISVTRRSLLGGAGVVVLGGVVGFAFGRGSSRGSAASGANGYGYTPPKSSSSPGRRLVALAKVPLGGGVVLGGPKIVVTRETNGALHGFSAVCTHQGCTVGSVRNGIIQCPCHLSQFDASTGHVVQGPAGQPLPIIPLLVVDGVVYAH